MSTGPSSWDTFAAFMFHQDSGRFVTAFLVFVCSVYGSSIRAQSASQTGAAPLRSATGVSKWVVSPDRQYEAHVRGWATSEQAARFNLFGGDRKFTSSTLELALCFASRVTVRARGRLGNSSTILTIGDPNRPSHGTKNDMRIVGWRPDSRRLLIARHQSDRSSLVELDVRKAAYQVLLEFDQTDSPFCHDSPKIDCIDPVGYSESGDSIVYRLHRSGGPRELRFLRLKLPLQQLSSVRRSLRARTRPPAAILMEHSVVIGRVKEDRDPW